MDTLPALDRATVVAGLQALAGHPELAFGDRGGERWYVEHDGKRLRMRETVRRLAGVERFQNRYARIWLDELGIPFGRLQAAGTELLPDLLPENVEASWDADLARPESVLRDSPPATTWRVRHRDQLLPLTAAVEAAIGGELARGVPPAAMEQWLARRGFELVPPSDTAPAWWVFQANQDRYDLVGAVRDLDRLTWRINQHGKEIRAQDRVVLWATGDVGAVAVCTVMCAPVTGLVDEDGDAYLTEDVPRDEGQLSVWLRVDHRLPSPVRRSDLLADPALQGLSILRRPQGTNFPVTPTQARSLARRLGLEVADEPQPVGISARARDILRALTRLPVARGQVALFKMLREHGAKGVYAADLQARLYGNHPNQASGLLAALSRKINETELLDSEPQPGVSLMLVEHKDGRKVARPELWEAIELLPPLLAEMDRPWDEVVAETNYVTCEMPPFLEPPRGFRPSQHSHFDALRTLVRQKRLIYSDETLSAFLLALQAKRFVILSGISGTGKTKLATTIARWAGASEGEPRLRTVEVIPVRPDWRDSRGLLGFYNPITETYSRTAFLDLVLGAEAEDRRSRTEGREPRPFFAVLDEMNLAHVEQYFADLLSAMESGEAVPLHHDPKVEQGTADGGDAVPMRLHVPRNLFFVGTVNVDETTHMFSPKVLDRAFVIELNEVWIDGEPPAGALRLSRLSESLSLLGPLTNADWDQLEHTGGPEARSALLAIQRTLTDERRPLGYRPLFEIARFLRLAFEQGDDTEAHRQAALDVAILQKVLPKLHGTQQELEAVLRRLFDVAIDGRPSTGEHPQHDPAHWRPDGSGRLARAEGATGERSDPVLPRCALKLHRMIRDVRRLGFTSFIG